MPEHTPWKAQFSLSEKLVRFLITDQFPQLSITTIQKLGSGWDNTIYLINNKYVFRFPHRKLAVDLIQQEIQNLPTIAHFLPCHIPNPCWIGRVTSDYPYPFYGSLIVPGQSAHQFSLSHTQRCQLVEPIAMFLKNLHNIDKNTVQAPENLQRLQPLLKGPEAIQRFVYLQELRILSGITRYVEIIEKTMTMSFPIRRFLCHGDLGARHIILDENREFIGVIDWGDLHIGTPAIDLSVVFDFFPREAHKLFFKIYGEVDEDILVLAKFRAVYLAAALLVYAHDIQDQQLLQEALFALDNILEIETECQSI